MQEAPAGHRENGQQVGLAADELRRAGDERADQSVRNMNAAAGGELAANPSMPS